MAGVLLTRHPSSNQTANIFRAQKTKVNKVNLPLRPIAFVRSPTYNLAKFLINVLSPLLKQTYSVKSSTEFVNIVNNLKCNNLHCFVSFNVVSLLTSIPTSNVLILIFRLLNQDNSLCDRTNLSVNDIIEGLSICLKSIVFSFKNVFYRQIFISRHICGIC